jgi:hypothetical protein
MKSPKRAVHSPELTRQLPAACRAVALSAAFACGCQGAIQPAKTEDQTRNMVPVPICVQRLPRSAAPGAVISLSPAEYWSLLLPSFDNNGRSIDPSAADCSGRASLAGLSSGGVNSLQVDTEKVTISPGADGMKIVWLQSHPTSVKSADGAPTVAGLLALTRQRDSYLETYAIGIHRGAAEGARFTLERMGPRLVVSSTEETCKGDGQNRRCSAHSSVYLTRTGELRQAASYPVDQSVSAPGPAGGELAEYRFSASAEYHPDAIRLTEHLSVRNKVQGEIRSSDLERAYRLENGQLVASGESLWTKTLRDLGMATRQ